MQSLEAQAAQRTGPSHKLDSILLELRRRVPGLRGSAIADKNGLPIASDLPPTVHMLMVTAMSALAMQSYSSILANLSLQQLDNIVAEGKDSFVIVKSMTGGNASFFAVLKHDADPELAKKEIARAADEAQTVLTG